MTDTTCPIKGCTRDIRAAGLCDTHYRRKRKYGDPEFMHKIKCSKCGQSFQSRTSRSKYCSPQCGVKKKTYKSKKSGPTCAECGVQMHRGKGVLPQGQARCMKCKNGGRGYFFKDGVRWTHGNSAYRMGCRCEVCVAAKRDANMAYKAKVKAEHGVNPSTLYNRRYRERTGTRYRMSSKDWIDPKLRLKLYERDGWLCHLCNEPVERAAHFNDDLAPSLDHLVPRIKGGSDDPENLKTAHRGCNSARRDSDLDVLEVV